MERTFADLNLSSERLKQLEELGFVEATEIQAQAIPPLLEGRDVVGQAQTGTGKTAAFSLPILERIDTKRREVQALILTPTRELAKQVNQAFQELSGDRRIRILNVYGGQSIDRQIQLLEKGTHIVVGTPGRVIDLLDRGNLKLDKIDWLVLDEADEMLSMGFLDDVETILKQAATDRQTAFFSATIDASIWNLVKKYMKSPVTVRIEQPKAAPQRIQQQVYMVPRGWSKAKALQPILEMEDPESAIIFVRTRKGASELTSSLQSLGHSVEEFHGDLTQSQRERLLKRFRSQQVRWVVATDIAARGLDVERLTHVINFDLPDNVDSYIHRIGRTGRAGREGTAISLIQPFERRKLRQIERHVRQNLKVRSLPNRSQIEACRLKRLENQLRDTITGERLASFLPMVSQLNEEYDVHAIAAAALQMAYDSNRANTSEVETPEKDTPERSTPKPRLMKEKK